MRIDPRVRSGFTIIELLVVIAVISVLIGVLLPALGLARSSAHLSVCMGTQRQLATANLVFMEENDRQYMVGMKVLEQYQISPVIDITVTDAVLRRWFDWRVLGPPMDRPMIDKKELRDFLSCPGDEEVPGVVQLGSQIDGVWTTEGTPGSYGISDAWVTAYSPGEESTGALAVGWNPYMTERDLFRLRRNPADVILFIDHEDSDGYLVALDEFVSSEDPTHSPLAEGTVDREKVLRRHMQRYSAAFADGHAESIHVDDMYAERFPPFYFQ